MSKKRNVLFGILLVASFCFYFFFWKRSFSTSFSYDELYAPRFSGEYVQLPSNNHTLTQLFTFEHLPIQNFDLTVNDEFSPELSWNQYFAYPLSRLAFDFSVVKIHGFRGSGFPSYIVDGDSEDRERITYYQGKVNDQREVVSFLQHLAQFSLAEARALLEKNPKLIPFIGVIEGCHCLSLKEWEKSLDGEAVCPSESWPIVKEFSLFMAKDTLFFVQELFPEALLPQNFNEERFIAGEADACIW